MRLSRRIVRTTGALVAALATVGGLASPVAAAPLRVEWVDDVAVEDYQQQVVADPATGDALVLQSRPEGAGDGSMLRRLDAATGTVEWTVLVPYASRLAVDPSSGQVVVGGARDAGQFLVLVSADGASVREVATTVDTPVLELVVDPTTGQICTLGVARRRSATPNAWVTSCWTSAGESVFVDTWQPPKGRSVASTLGIDPRTHRVYIAGTARPTATGRRSVVLLSREASGEKRWDKIRPGAFMPGYLDVAIDPRRGTVQLVNEPALIESPVQLFSFAASGRLRFARSWEDLGSVYETDVQVTSKGHVLVVASSDAYASLRTYAASGRLLDKARVRFVREPRENYLQEIAIDPRRELVHLLVGGDRLPIRVSTWTFDGRRRSSVVVERRRAIFGDITVDPASGRVLASTLLIDEPGSRVTALR